jgi:hypothetical protein
MPAERKISPAQSALIIIFSAVAISAAFISISLSWRHNRYTAHTTCINETLPEMYNNELKVARDNQCVDEGILWNEREAICDMTLDQYIQSKQDRFNPYCPKNI